MTNVMIIWSHIITFPQFLIYFSSSSPNPSAFVKKKKNSHFLDLVQVLTQFKFPVAVISDKVSYITSECSLFQLITGNIDFMLNE